MIKSVQVKTRVIKLLPTDDNADVVLSTLYIDETKLVVLKAKTLQGKMAVTS